MVLTSRLLEMPAIVRGKILHRPSRPATPNSSHCDARAMAGPCKACAVLVFLPVGVRSFPCSKCKLVSLLEKEVIVLEAPLSTD